MFKLSTKIKYGFRALLELAKDKKTESVNLREIAEKQNISHKYLENIFTFLKNSNLVRSARGPGGGYTLTKSPDELTIYNIFTAIDGPFSISDCVTDPNICENSKDCPARVFLVELQEHITHYLKSKTLKSYCRQYKD